MKIVYDMVMLGKVLAFVTLASFVLLSAILQSTSPSTIHPLGILVVFVLIYLLALGVLTFFIVSAARILRRFSKIQSAISLKQAYYFASVLALAPVLIMGMRSIGHTGLYDILLVLIFEIVACFYIARRR